MTQKTLLVAALCFACAFVATCSSRTSDEVGSHQSSSTIVTVGTSTWLVSPDDSQLIEIVDAAVRSTIPLEFTPSRLATSSGVLALSYSNAPFVGIVDRTHGNIHNVEVSCRSTGGIAITPHSPHQILATCPFDNAVSVVESASSDANVGDAQTAHERGVVATAKRPTSIEVSETDVAVVSDFRSTIDVMSLEALLELATNAPSLPLASGASSQWSQRSFARDASHNTSMAVSLVRNDAGEFTAGYQLVDNNSPAPKNHGGSYGELVDGNPRVEPAVDGYCSGTFSFFDQTQRELSGPVALGWDETRNRLWVVGRFSKSVSVLKCTSGTPELIGTFAVGDGASGIAVRDNVAYVDVAFDGVVAVLDGNELGRGMAPKTEIRRNVESRFSESAQRGRRLFNDATNTHLTPTGVVACASCHLNGGDDGKTWRIETQEIDEKLRATPALWGMNSKLLHWTADERDLAKLSRHTIVNLLGGDSLLINTHDIANYLGELQTPVQLDVQRPEAARDVAAGNELFERSDAQCASCHVGNTGSDGRAHQLERTNQQSLATSGAVVTPTLFGVGSRAAYFHDHAEASLHRAVTGSAHGGSWTFSDEEVGQLVAYLRTR